MLVPKATVQQSLKRPYCCKRHTFDLRCWIEYSGSGGKRSNLSHPRSQPLTSAFPYLHVEGRENYSGQQESGARWLREGAVQARDPQNDSYERNQYEPY
jgi:hypothetical protein